MGIWILGLSFPVGLNWEKFEFEGQDLKEGERIGIVWWGISYVEDVFIGERGFERRGKFIVWWESWGEEAEPSNRV